MMDTRSRVLARCSSLPILYSVQVSATTTPAPLQTEEPKTCSQCGKSFSSPDILKNHTKLMHGSTIVSKKAPLSEMETQNHNTLEDIIKQNSKNKSTENLKYLKETSKWIFQTEKKNFSEENIGSIQRKIMKQNEIGWPSVFSPEVEECPKCGNKEISQPQKHQGSKRAFFLTRGSCSPITIMVRKCRSCFLLIQPKPPLCLNIGDNLIVTLDVMYLMRSMVHTCAPLSTAAEVVIADLSRSCAFMEGLTGQEKEWIRRRLTAGFLALEALDKDEEESQVGNYPHQPSRTLTSPTFTFTPPQLSPTLLHPQPPPSDMWTLRNCARHGPIRWWRGYLCHIKKRTHGSELRL